MNMGLLGTEMIMLRRWNMRLKFKMTKREKIWTVAIVLLVMLIVGVVLYLQSDRVGHALKSKNFRQVQLAVKQSITYLDDMEKTGEENAVTDTSYTLKKDGDTEHITGYLEQYRYMRDGEEFGLGYDDFYESIGENGKWVEYRAGTYEGYKFFDFSVFENYQSSDFKKVEDYYIPKREVDAFFCEFFGIDEEEMYADCDMKFYFEKGKLSKLIVSHIYGDIKVVMTYEFSYQKETIGVPEADVKYD